MDSPLDVRLFDGQSTAVHRASLRQVWYTYERTLWEERVEMSVGQPKLLLLTTALLAVLLTSCCGTREAVSYPSSLPASIASASAHRLVLATLTPIAPPDLPSAWQVTSSALSDVTGDGEPEWVLVVWRPWRDWPVQRWSTVPSPIRGFQDAEGRSCHLILLDPRDGHEIWAGSALPVPFLALALDDLDGDGTDDVLTVEGTYRGNRDGPGTHVDVWSWNGFGFTLERRSPPGVYNPTCLTDADRCGLLEVAAR
jgi:hypothetical protein